ncbi:MAG TPA: SURF1 family cytochrome oxidase biogenesis protein [Sphingomicrobium sp.]|nr:SURF1 family cytochrome oxidase biogenesis protein [Sphingomicrobium sp.]
MSLIRRLPLIPTLLVAAAVATMIGLGIWQIARAGEKKAMLARHAAAQGLPEIAFPTMPTKGELPLYRRASGLCIRVVGWTATAGADRKGESGYSHFADCSTGAEGPGMVVDTGWSKDPNAKANWAGGKVTGVIGPDRNARIRLVSGEGLGGLQASAPPSPASIPNNHLSYAVQWFFFAIAAGVIYLLALRKRLKDEDAR